MPTRRALLGGISAGCGALAGCSALTGERDVLSEFSYRVDLQPTETVRDATFLVPAPVAGGETVIADRLEADVLVPEEWSVSVADTDRGPMLEIAIEELRPRQHPLGIDALCGVSEEIDTRNALENAPTLQPKADVQRADCDFPHPEEWDDRLRCYTYEGSLHGTYEPTGTEVDVGVSLSGSNSWHSGGWRGNEYTDGLHGFVDGTGWISTRGGFREGVGVY